MSGLFITGSGTGVGKTLVTCILLHQLRRAGHVARALKPVITGFDADAVADSDTGRLLAAMDEPLDKAAVGSVSPWRFADPISPDMAAAREGLRDMEARKRIAAELLEQNSTDQAGEDAAANLDNLLAASPEDENFMLED